MSQRNSHHSLALSRRPTTVGDPRLSGGILLLSLVLVLLITNGGAG